MIEPIIIAVIVVAGIGLLIGLILAISSIIFAVPTNKTVEKLTEILPGANCGACGFSGCAGYANALAEGKAKAGLCPVGGEKVSKEVAAVLGVEVDASVRKVSVVHCKGNCDNTENKVEYTGIKSCLAASRLGGGITSCLYGCIGLGDCESVCTFDAIHVCNGVAVVDNDKCTGCSMCKDVCPRKLIDIVETKDKAAVLCSNKDKGAVVRKLCKTGCIGCQKCAKNCPVNAITVTDFCAYVDPSICTGCKTCVDNCPVKCINFFNK